MYVSHNAYDNMSEVTTASCQHRTSVAKIFNQECGFTQESRLVVPSMIGNFTGAVLLPGGGMIRNITGAVLLPGGGMIGNLTDAVLPSWWTNIYICTSKQYTSSDLHSTCITAVTRGM